LENEALDVRLSCRSTVDPRASIYQAIKQTDWILIELNRETRTLETIFRELTRED
jgi:hypothetical protein